MTDAMMKQFLRMVLDKLEEEPSSVASAQECAITPNDILTDFKLFADEMYEGTVEKEEDDSLVFAFENGQKFRLTVHEIALELVD